MNRTKLHTAATFAGGLLMGGLLTGWVAIVEQPGHADERPSASDQAPPFPDVPTGHWAAKSVAAIKAEGIAKGAATTGSEPVFNGDKYVTRYEAAVLLDRFVHYVERGHAPLHATMLDPKLIPAVPSGWAHDETVDLIQHRYIAPSNSLFAAPGTAAVGAKQMSDGLSEAVERVSDRSLKPTPDTDEDAGIDPNAAPAGK